MLPLISGSHAHGTGRSHDKAGGGTTTPTPTPADVKVEIPPDVAIPENVEGELTINEALDLALGSKDFDCDDITNRYDNCPLVFNPEQGDYNKNGIGDACDTALKTYKEVDSRCDSDGDGIINTKDNCKLVCNPEQEDKNKNGIGDACDSAILGTKFQRIQECANKHKRYLKPKSPDACKPDKSPLPL